MREYDDYTVSIEGLQCSWTYDSGWDVNYLDEEAEEWCIEYIGYHPVIDEEYAYFDKKEHAVSFKLKWG